MSFDFGSDPVASPDLCQDCLWAGGENEVQRDGAVGDYFRLVNASNFTQIDPIICRFGAHPWNAAGVKIGVGVSSNSVSNFSLVKLN